MRSELYNGLLEEGKLFSLRVSGMNWLRAEESKRRMRQVKEYWRGVDEVFAEALDGYELFAEDTDGSLWLEDRKSGRTEFYSADCKVAFPDPEFNSVEAAVFTCLLDRAAETDGDPESIKRELTEAADTCGKYFPPEWTEELRRIAGSGALISEEQATAIRDALCI